MTPFPNEFHVRLAAVQDRIVNSRADAVLVTSLTNVQWLSGLAASNAAMVVTADRCLLATDGRYADAVDRTNMEVIVGRDLHRLLIERTVDDGSRVVGIDDEAFGYRAHEVMADYLASRDAEFCDASRLVADLRAVKSTTEHSALRNACAVTTSALARLLPELHAGQSELKIARRLEFLMSLEGAQDRSFPTIVAGGPNSAIPHHVPTSRVLATGEILKIDFGALVDGYHADCTRTFVMGARPTPEQERVYGVVAAAAERARMAVRAGLGTSQLDAIARSHIEAEGFGEQFVHGLGHGVGLEVHEAPMLGTSSVGSLSVGNVITIEPGIYLPGRFGVRIEDVCLVTKGDAEVLTDFPRELLRVG